VCFSALEIEADRVHDGESTSDRRRDRAILIDIGVEPRYPGVIAGEQIQPPIGMSRGSPNIKTGGAQMANDAPPEKPRSAKYRHQLRGHVAIFQRDGRNVSI